MTDFKHNSIFCRGHFVLLENGVKFENNLQTLNSKIKPNERLIEFLGHEKLINDQSQTQGNIFKPSPSRI